MQGWGVKKITVGEIVREYGKIDLLKLDVEGAELNIFASGCEQWLTQVRCIMVELHEHFAPGCTQQFMDAIRPFGFKVTHRSRHNLTVQR